MANPLVSVILPVYNDPERLRKCLATLEAQTYPGDRYEVIVVDNGSDESLEPLTAAFPHVRLTTAGHPGSYAARNRGLALARGEVIAFTDADCLPAHDWIEKGVAALGAEPNCGLVGGKVEVFFRDPQRPTAVELYESITGFLQRDYVEQAQFAATANVFTFRSVVERVGPFEEALKSCGDLEWGQRVYAHGYRIVYADDVRVAHPARSSYGEVYRRARRIIGGMHDLDQRKHCRYIGLGRGFLVDSLPPVRASLRAWADPRLHGLTSKAKVIVVMFFVQYVQVWERIRLGLGGTSMR
jgi:glycosyltransferase involved in cell wall biosynthesis